MPPISSSILSRLRDQVLWHPKFTEVSEALFTHMTLGAPGRMLVVTGPTGVGKTTLLEHFTRKLHEHSTQSDRGEQGVPIIVQAIPGERKLFDWKDFYLDLLAQLKEPAIKKKTNLEERLAELRSGRAIRYSSSISTREAGKLVARSLRHRRPAAVVVDEAQHLRGTQSQRESNLDVLKGLANEKSTSLVMFGTYALREFIYGSGQISRRIKVIDFGRYTESKTDYEHFAKAFISIRVGLELPIDERMDNEVSYLYNHSLGCIGILFDWVERATIAAIQLNASLVQMKHFELERHSNVQLEKMSREIIEFEAQHDSSRGFNFGAFADSFLSLPVPDNKEKGIRSQRKPGKRLPVRDPVG